MPRYRVKDNETGDTIAFEWHGTEPPTEADMAEVFAEAKQAKPTPAADDRLVNLIGADTMSTRKADVLRRVAASPMGDSLVGALQDGGSGLAASPIAGVLGAGVTRLARPLMRAAQGPQAGVMKKFPQVDLAAVALREGVGATNVAKATRLGREAAHNIHTVAGQLDAAGAPPIKPREIVKGLRGVYDDAVAAERGGIPGQKAKVLQVVADIRRQMPAGGLSVSEALKPKTQWQRIARPKLGAEAGQAVAIAPEVADAVGKAFTGAVRSRGLDKALTRSQEMMALQRATRAASVRPSLLRNLLGMTVGTGAGMLAGSVAPAIATAAVPMLALSPTGLSMAAKAVHAGGSQTVEGLLRALMSSHGSVPPETP